MSNPTELPDLDTVIAFLLGEGPLLGQHFGEKHPESTTYWWRDYLRSAARRAQPEGMSIALREVTDKLSATAAENLSLNLANIDLRDQLARVTGIRPEGEAPQAEAERAQQAAAPGALALLNAEEMAALHRFQETCQDFDSGGYDVDKNMMKRLASIGVIESKGFNRYQFTEFGDYVVENQAPSAPGTPEAPQTAAARDVLAERQRQMQAEGWTLAHDDQYDGDELSLAAACYALAGDGGKFFPAPDYWPWDPNWWKPTTDRRNLIKAGALILAEIERLDRAAVPKGDA